MMYSYGPPHMAEQRQDDQHEHTFSNYVRIRDVVQKTCRMRWTIGKSGERGSGISVLPAWHDDDDCYFYHHMNCKLEPLPCLISSYPLPMGLVTRSTRHAASRSNGGYSTIMTMHFFWLSSLYHYNPTSRCEFKDLWQDGGDVKT